jgi:hypothetical protein
MSQELMKRIGLIFILLAVTAVSIHAQGDSQAIQIDKYDDRTEPNQTLVKKTLEFLKALSEAPTTTRGFVAIACRNCDSVQILRKQIRDIVDKNKHVRKRVELTQPGILYDTRFEMTEFWLIPKNAPAPYYNHDYGPVCPNITLSGKSEVRYLDKFALFTVTFSGGSAESLISFKWSVVGGKIVSGKGSPSIKVKIDRAADQVTADVKIVGIDPAERCPANFSFTSKVNH